MPEEQADVGCDVLHHSTSPDLWIPSALEYFAPAAEENFKPEGPWQHSWYVLNIDESDFKSKKPSPQGVLRITRGKTAWGKFDFNIDVLTSRHQWKAFHHTNIEAKCKADMLATPISWKLESVILDPYLNPFEETRVRNSGSLAHGSVTIDAEKKRRISVTENVAANYGLFDAVQRLAYDDFACLCFCMLEDMELVKPGQMLYRLGHIEVEAVSGTIKLHGFLRLGTGILPCHYWLDDSGRLVLASGSLRAFVFNPNANIGNCDTSWVFHEVRAK
jgi:hypothetical protein